MNCLRDKLTRWWIIGLEFHVVNFPGFKIQGSVIYDVWVELILTRHKFPHLMFKKLERQYQNKTVHLSNLRSMDYLLSLIGGSLNYTWGCSEYTFYAQICFLSLHSLTWKQHQLQSSRIFSTVIDSRCYLLPEKLVLFGCVTFCCHRNQIGCHSCVEEFCSAW